MKKFNLISNYTKAHYKKKRSAVNSSLTSNILNRNFNQKQPLKVVITDLTYVRVDSKWHYICLIVVQEINAKKATVKAVSDEYSIARPIVSR